MASGSDILTPLMKYQRPSSIAINCELANEIGDDRIVLCKR